MSDEKNIAGWEAIAERYQRERGWPSVDLCWGHRVAPERELKLLGDVRGKRALVLGCGGGQDVIALAKLGAAHVTGVDFSKTQLAHAKENLARADVAAHLVESSISELPMFGDERFDLVVSVHVMSYVEHVDRCFAEARRVLVPSGILAFSTQHPMDCATSDEAPYGFIKSYFELETNEVWSSLGGHGAPFRRYHRTVADYFKCLQNARFTIEALLEPKPTNDMVWEGREYFAKLAVVPGTLVFKARK